MTHIGDVIYLSILGQPLLILTSQTAAVDLLDKRGAKYANRPRLVVGGEMCACHSLGAPNLNLFTLGLATKEVSV